MEVTSETYTKVVDIVKWNVAFPRVGFKSETENFLWNGISWKLKLSSSNSWSSTDEKWKLRLNQVSNEKFRHFPLALYIQHNGKKHFLSLTTINTTSNIIWSYSCSSFVETYPHIPVTDSKVLFILDFHDVAMDYGIRAILPKIDKKMVIWGALIFCFLIHPWIISLWIDEEADKPNKAALHFNGPGRPPRLPPLAWAWLPPLKHAPGSDGNTCLENLSLDMSKLLDKSPKADVQLKCGDLTIGAHKLILGARSEVFRTMMQSDTPEGRKGVVDIVDMEPRVLQIFVRYIYTGTLPELTEDTILSLYEAAHKYRVGGLRKRSSRLLTEILSRENALKILPIADAHEDEYL